MMEQFDEHGVDGATGATGAHDEFAAEANLDQLITEAAQTPPEAVAFAPGDNRGEQHDLALDTGLEDDAGGTAANEAAGATNVDPTERAHDEDAEALDLTASRSRGIAVPILSQQVASLPEQASTNVADTDEGPDRYREGVDKVVEATLRGDHAEAAVLADQLGLTKAHVADKIAGREYQARQQAGAVEDNFSEGEVTDSEPTTANALGDQRGREAGLESQPAIAKYLAEHGGVAEGFTVDQVLDSMAEGDPDPDARARLAAEFPDADALRAHLAEGEGPWSEAVRAGAVAIFNNPPETNAPKEPVSGDVLRPVGGGQYLDVQAGRTQVEGLQALRLRVANAGAMLEHGVDYAELSEAERVEYDAAFGGYASATLDPDLDFDKRVELAERFLGHRVADAAAGGSESGVVEDARAEPDLRPVVVTVDTVLARLGEIDPSLREQVAGDSPDAATLASRLQDLRLPMSDALRDGLLRIEDNEDPPHRPM